MTYAKKSGETLNLKEKHRNNGNKPIPAGSQAQLLVPGNL